MSNKTTEISLFLYENEIELLELLPGKIEQLIEQGITFRLQNSGVRTGAWGGKMPDHYPLRVQINKDLVDALERIRLAPETAVRCFLNAISGDYISERRALAAAKAQGEEATP